MVRRRTMSFFIQIVIDYSRFFLNIRSGAKVVQTVYHAVSHILDMFLLMYEFIKHMKILV